MKAEHRHELKTNELAHWLTNFPQWVTQNRSTIIYIVVFIIGSIAYFGMKKYMKTSAVRKQTQLTGIITQLPGRKLQIIQAQGQGIDASYMLLSTADNLQISAQKASDGDKAALALIKRAETLRIELHYRLDTVNQEDMATQINKAMESYTQALLRAPSNPTLKSKALFGIAICHEELADFTQAAQTYLKITEDPLLQGTAAAAAAQQRLNTMSTYEKKVTFRPPPKPAPELTQPQLELKEETDQPQTTEPESKTPQTPGQ